MSNPPTTEAEGLRASILQALADSGLIGTIPKYLLDNIVEAVQLETAKAVREARIDEIKMFQQVLRGGKLPVVASLFDKRIAELQKESE